jgi:hypothetical protein
MLGADQGESLELVGGTRPGASWSLLLNLPACVRKSFCAQAHSAAQIRRPRGCHPHPARGTLTCIEAFVIVDKTGSAASKEGTMSSTAYPPSFAYPLSVRGFFDQPSRALWLIKWLLLIPHYIILAFLWLAFWIVTVIAFFAILFTTRYPKGLFDFNVGVIRWSWQVSFYGYAALGTDRYPPFTLADVPHYPARVDLEYPQQLNRWLPLVKWLLAFPQYILVGALVGSGYVVATSVQDGRAVSYSTPSLIGACVLIAAIAMLFTTRYPPGLFDLVLGIDRWGYRLLVYVALMTDRYPPFRLDQGSIDLEGPAQPPEPSVASQ